MKEAPVLYSTGCPKCCVLKSKLDGKEIDYVVNCNVAEMKNLGIDQVPVLYVNGEYMDFKQAVDWVNRQEE